MTAVLVTLAIAAAGLLAFAGTFLLSAIFGERRRRDWRRDL